MGVVLVLFTGRSRAVRAREGVRRRPSGPGAGLPGADVEAVAVEEHGDGLDPSEVSGHAAVAALANEVRIDVEVAVGDDTEVGVRAAVEVERIAVAADEAWVTTRSRSATHCTLKSWMDRNH